MPVLRADVASRVCGYAAGVDNDAEDDEADTCYDLDDGEDEFDLIVKKELITVSQVSLPRGAWGGGSIAAVT